MPQSYKKKPLGAWPENKKHEVSEPDDELESGKREGHAPDPEVVEEQSTLEAAQEAGLYSDQDEEHPAPLGLGEEENKNVDTENHS